MNQEKVRHPNTESGERMILLIVLIFNLLQEISRLKRLNEQCQRDIYQLEAENSRLQATVESTIMQLAQIFPGL